MLDSHSDQRERAIDVMLSTYGQRGLARLALNLGDERDRLRALLKRAHDRDKWQGEFPTIAWYDEVARYFKGQVPSDPALAASDEKLVDREEGR